MTTGASGPAQLVLRAATADDVPQIVAWRAERAAWLAEHGSTQWGDAGLTRDVFARRVGDSIAAGETWMAIDTTTVPPGRPVGTIAVDASADAGLWAPGEIADAYVVHRMIVPLAESGRGVGGFMLRAAEQIAQAAGRSRLVLDAWGSNEGLRSYYAAAGFEHLRDAPAAPTGNVMALFTRPIEAHQQAC